MLLASFLFGSLTILSIISMLQPNIRGKVLELCYLMVQNKKALNFYLSQGFEIVSKVDDELGGYYYMSFGAQT